MSGLRWYSHYIDDYDRKTCGLSFEQDGAYRRLLDRFYATGAALPLDMGETCRMVRASTSHERKSVEYVLSRYWQRTADGWVNKRAAEEMAEAEALTEKKRLAGQAGGIAARGKSGRPADSKTIADEIADELQNNTQSQSQSHSPDGEKTETAKAVSPSKPPKGNFEEFWVHCPRKVGKGAAKKAYARALQRTAPETILTGMQRYAASRAGQDDQFTTHPATWLNQDRWSDEAAKPNGNGAANGLTPQQTAQKARLAELAERERLFLERQANGLQN